MFEKLDFSAAFVRAVHRSDEQLLCLLPRCMLFTSQLLVDYSVVRAAASWGTSERAHSLAQPWRYRTVLNCPMIGTLSKSEGNDLRPIVIFPTSERSARISPPRTLPRKCLGKLRLHDQVPAVTNCAGWSSGWYHGTTCMHALPRCHSVQLQVEGTMPSCRDKRCWKFKYLVVKALISSRGSEQE